MISEVEPNTQWKLITPGNVYIEPNCIHDTPLVWIPNASKPRFQFLQLMACYVSNFSLTLSWVLYLQPDGIQALTFIFPDKSYSYEL